MFRNTTTLYNYTYMHTHMHIKEKLFLMIIHHSAELKETYTIIVNTKHEPDLTKIIPTSHVDFTCRLSKVQRIASLCPGEGGHMV